MCRHGPCNKGITQCAFCVLCVYSKFWHHPHPLGYRSFADSIAELAHGENLCTQSLSHSPSLFDALGTEATCFIILVIITITTTGHTQSNVLTLVIISITTTGHTQSNVLTLVRGLSVLLSADGLSLRTGTLPELDLGWVDAVSCPLADDAEVDFSRLSLVAAVAVLAGCLSGTARVSRLRSPAASFACSSRESRWDVTTRSLRPQTDRCLSAKSLSLDRSTGRSGTVRSCSADFGPDAAINHRWNSHQLSR